MNSMREIIGIMMVASLATLALFGIPTVIEIVLHRRAKKKNQQEAERVAKESLKNTGTILRFREKTDSGRVAINGKPKYARVLIRRRNNQK